MIFTELFIKGAYEIELEPHVDDRGFFARMFCRKEFASRGLRQDICQVNCSYSRRKGTLRGMHYQAAPHSEAKLLRCMTGRVFDVLVDLREDSPTRGRWHGCELSQHNRTMLYIPEGCAHGFITLEDDTELLYFHSQFHAPEAERGIIWNDPKVGIQWPMEPAIISERDRHFPNF